MLELLLAVYLIIAACLLLMVGWAWLQGAECPWWVWLFLILWPITYPASFFLSREPRR